MKDYRIPLLADYYGSMLTPRSLEAVRLFYERDLSLGEIAERMGVSRQAIGETVTKAAAQLRDCEEKLGLLSTHEELRSRIEEIIADCEAGRSENAIDRLNELKRRI